MFRKKLSNFIRNNIDKIRDVGQKLTIVAIVVFIATIMLSITSNNPEYISNEKDYKDIYKPTGTVIKGSNVSEKQYQIDSNIVNKFLEFCNSGKLEEAYSLVGKECKEEMYPTIEHFKEYYYNTIFDKKREYSLQAWISTSKYNVYKIRYTNSMLSTGIYEEDDVYQDYITLNKNSNKVEISVGNFVMSKVCNIVTIKNNIQATVKKKTVYIYEEEYEIEIKNYTDKTILLDTLEDVAGIKLIANTNEYNSYTDKLFFTNLKINPGETKTLTLRFKKNLSSNNSSEKISFLRVIKDYEAYVEDKKNYKETIKFDIKVEE